MKPTPETLCAIGRALYGPSWQGALADALEVNVRTMRRWAKGEFDMPEAIWGELGALCAAHSIQLSIFAAVLRKL